MEQEIKPYKYPKPEDKSSWVVLAYKRIEIGDDEVENRLWDTINFARCRKTAIKMLKDIFNDDMEKCAEYMDSFANWYRGKGIPFKMETMYKNYFDWKQWRREENAKYQSSSIHQ